MEQLLNGRFEYEVPHLLLSETEVALTLDEGQNFRGELNIGAEDGRRVKGIVTTDHQRIVLAKNQFQGTASTIEYRRFIPWQILCIWQAMISAQRTASL